MLGGGFPDRLTDFFEGRALRLFLRPTGLGMRIITAFVKQLAGTLETHARNPGTEFVITIPR